MMSRLGDFLHTLFRQDTPEELSANDLADDLVWVEGNAFGSGCYNFKHQLCHSAVLCSCYCHSHEPALLEAGQTLSYLSPKE